MLPSISTPFLILEEQILGFAQWARMGHTKGISHSQPAREVQKVPYKIENKKRGEVKNLPSPIKN